MEDDKIYIDFNAPQTGKLIVTLCGSLAKAQEIFNDVQMRLERDGHVCFSVGFSEKDYAPPTPEEKMTLDKVHCRKICLSDCILVLDVDKYIGQSTGNEIEFARVMNKPIYYLSESGYFIDPQKVVRWFDWKTRRAKYYTLSTAFIDSKEKNAKL